MTIHPITPAVRAVPDPPQRARLTSWQRMQAETARQALVETEAVSLADCDPRDMGRIIGRLESATRTVLDVLDAVTDATAPDIAAIITVEQSEVLAGALADAIDYRTPEGFCADCETRPEGLCNDHAADLDLTDAYIALSRELGIEVER